MESASFASFEVPLHGVGKRDLPFRIISLHIRELLFLFIVVGILIHPLEINEGLR